MAYFSKENKQKVAPAIKAVLKKYNVKGTLAVRNYSTLVVNIKKGMLDFLEADYKIQLANAYKGHGEPHKKTHIQVNQYYAEEWYREAGEVKIANFIKELIEAMKGANWFDKSDIQSDYFHTAYYMNINIGQWDKPYELI